MPGGALRATKGNAGGLSAAQRKTAVAGRPGSSRSGREFRVRQCEALSQVARRDLKRAQKADGSLPGLAPDFWRYFSDNMTWPESC